MIIVEGPDGAGKTTLIESIVEATGLPVAPRVVSKDAEAMVDLKKWVKDNIAGGFQKMIFDRHRLVSELIYGPILRSKPEPGFDDPEWLHEHLFGLYREVKPFIIYCLPPAQAVWQNVMTDDDNKVFHSNPTAVHQIYELYRTKAVTDSLFHSRAFIYDYTDKATAEMTLSYLIRVIKEATR